MQFLVSAGEASGDLYASGTIEHLSRIAPGLSYYGCAGPRLQQAGVHPIVDAGNISVVGLAEVLRHLPRIYGQYRRLVNHARKNPPVAALLTDNPDFNLRLARQLKAVGIPIFYLVAPQVWAWRQGRVKVIRELVDHLYCLFPFEEKWFRERGVNARYIGHPLAHLVQARLSREHFFALRRLHRDRPMVVLLPGSRGGEVARHLPILLHAVELMRSRLDIQAVLAISNGFGSQPALLRFRERIAALSIQVVENDTWDAIAHADVALAASGTVTIEAAVLGTPMVTFYRVNPLSWYAGRHLVKAPFLSMVNLIAEEQIVPELIQAQMTPAKLASAATELLTDEARVERMKRDLAQVRQKLTLPHDPLAHVARLISDAMQAGGSGVANAEGHFLQETIN